MMGEERKRVGTERRQRESSLSVSFLSSLPCSPLLSSAFSSSSLQLSNLLFSSRSSPLSLSLSFPSPLSIFPDWRHGEKGMKQFTLSSALLVYLHPVSHPYNSLCNITVTRLCSLLQLSEGPAEVLWDGGQVALRSHLISTG